MPRVLILCTGNSARSQMAEGLLRRLEPALEIRSAGTRPAERVHPAAVEVMAEAGIDISGARPKAVEAFLDQPFDYVITVCGGAAESCPAFRGAVGRRLHFGFDDPAAATGSEAEVLAVFRRVRDQIRERLGRFARDEFGPRIRPATTGDLDAVRALLARCGLPADGLAEQFGEAYSVAIAAGEVAGCAGIERYGEYGLLRSVAVAPERRGTGTGARLVEDRLEWARGRALRAVYLLTTTAPGYFDKAGFRPVPRENVPAGIRGSREFAHACPASAIVMEYLPSKPGGQR